MTRLQGHRARTQGRAAEGRTGRRSYSTGRSPDAPRRSVNEAVEGRVSVGIMDRAVVYTVLDPAVK